MILLESGDNILMESGGFLLLESDVIITIEGNAFAREIPGVNVDGNRLIRFQMDNADDVVFDLEETEVS